MRRILATLAVVGALLFSAGAAWAGFAEDTSDLPVCYGDNWHNCIAAEANLDVFVIGSNAPNIPVGTTFRTGTVINLERGEKISILGVGDSILTLKGPHNLPISEDGKDYYYVHIAEIRSQEIYGEKIIVKIDSQRNIFVDPVILYHKGIKYMEGIDTPQDNMLAYGYLWAAGFHAHYQFKQPDMLSKEDQSLDTLTAQRFSKEQSGKSTAINEIRRKIENKLKVVRRKINPELNDQSPRAAYTRPYPGLTEMITEIESWRQNQKLYKKVGQ